MSAAQDVPPEIPGVRSLGEQELELLRWIAQQGPSTVGETVEGFGAPRALSRSTVVTVMERLRHKNYLTRKKHEGVYRYASPVASEALLGSLVQRFIERTLAGSLSPLLAYFANGQKLLPEELAQLESLIARLEREKATKAATAQTAQTVQSDKEKGQ